MKTSDDAENMQDDMGSDSFASASPTAAPSFTSQVVLTPHQALHSGNRAGDGMRASFWIQRLKPRDEQLETFDRTEKSFVTEAKHDLLSEKQQSYSGEKQQIICKWERGIRVHSSFSPSNSGCIEQFYPIQDATPQRKSLMLSMTNSRCASEPAIVAQTASQAVQGPSPVLNGVHAEGSILASSLGKPPLPPMHGKCGFLSRHPGYMSQGCSLWPACKITSSATNNKLARPPWITSSVTKEPVSTVNMSKGPFLTERHRAQDTLEHGIASSKEEKASIDINIGAVDAAPGPQGFIPATGTKRQELRGSLIRTTAHLKPPEQIENQDCQKMAITTLEMHRPKKMDSLAADKLGGVKVQLVQARGASKDSLVTEKITSKWPVDCGGLDKADKALNAAFTASSTPTFPWEMFGEAAGTSRTARQEFVDVYNRARNELKNQKASTLVTKAFENELDSFPRLASRGAKCVKNTSMVMHDAHSSEAGSQAKISEEFNHAPKPELQQQQLPGRQLHGSFLEGRDLETNCQAYGSGHFPWGKDSSVLHGQPGGGFHRHLEPSLVAPTHCSLTLSESSSFRLGFISGGAPEQCTKGSSTHKKLFLPKLSGKTELQLMDNKAPMLLSKRQAGVLEGGSPPTVVARKDSVKQGENQPSKSEVWLQRWYPSQSAVRHTQEHKLLKPDRSQQGLAGFPNEFLEAKERNTNGADNERHSKKRVIDKGISCQGIAAETQPVDRFKACSGKFIPSAAAMAIAGTAAQQFYTVQPQWQKGSFSFWSGLGIPSPQTSKSVVEGGENRHSSEAGPLSKP